MVISARLSELDGGVLLTATQLADRLFVSRNHVKRLGIPKIVTREGDWYRVSDVTRRLEAPGVAALLAELQAGYWRRLELYRRQPSRRPAARAISRDALSTDEYAETVAQQQRAKTMNWLDGTRTGRSEERRWPGITTRRHKSR